MPSPRICFTDLALLLQISLSGNHSKVTISHKIVTMKAGATLVLLLALSSIKASTTILDDERTSSEVNLAEDNSSGLDESNVPKSRQKRWLLFWCGNFPLCCDDLDHLGNDKCAFACPVCPVKRNPCECKCAFGNILLSLRQ